MAQPKLRLARVVVRLTLTFLFLFCASVLIASANGYIFNEHTWQFEQTGLVNLTVKQEPVTVSLNGKKKIYQKSPVNLSYLVPGLYQVEIQKPGYITWHHSFQIQPGQVIVNPFIQLFLEDNTVIPAPSDHITALVHQPDFTSEADLDVRGNEIWAKSIERTYPFRVRGDEFSLISRFSSPVLGARWWEGKTHIIFQLDRELRIIDSDGTNDTVLAVLESNVPTEFTSIENGKILIYKNGDTYFERRLQP